jgi:O-antigen biosynthesis protein WbqV
MTRLSNLTLRNLLIAAHDALATTLAVLVSLYLRLEGGYAFPSPGSVAAQPSPCTPCWRGGVLRTSDHLISRPDAINIFGRGHYAEAGGGC